MAFWVIGSLFIPGFKITAPVGRTDIKFRVGVRQGWEIAFKTVSASGQVWQQVDPIQALVRLEMWDMGSPLTSEDSDEVLFFCKQPILGK